MRHRVGFKVAKPLGRGFYIVKAPVI